jgi:hypothetical protein
VNVPTPIIRGLVSYEAWLVQFGAMDRDDLLRVIVVCQV